MTPELALRVIEQERLDVLAEGMTEAECQQIAAYVLATEYRKRILGPSLPLDIRETAEYWAYRSQDMSAQGSIMDLYKLANWIERTYATKTP